MGVVTLRLTLLVSSVLVLTFAAEHTVSYPELQFNTALTYSLNSEDVLILDLPSLEATFVVIETDACLGNLPLTYVSCSPSQNTSDCVNVTLISPLPFSRSDLYDFRIILKSAVTIQIFVLDHQFFGSIDSAEISNSTDGTYLYFQQPSLWPSLSMYEIRGTAAVGPYGGSLCRFAENVNVSVHDIELTSSVTDNGTFWALPLTSSYFSPDVSYNFSMYICAYYLNDNYDVFECTVVGPFLLSLSAPDPDPNPDSDFSFAHAWPSIVTAIMIMCLLLGGIIFVANKLWTHHQKPNLPAQCMPVMRCSATRSMTSNAKAASAIHPGSIFPPSHLSYLSTQNPLFQTTVSP